MRYTLDQLYTLYCAQMERARDFHISAMRLMSHSPSLAAQDQKRASFHYGQARFFRREYAHARSMNQ
jgi:hypothetical protein